MHPRPRRAGKRDYRIHHPLAQPPRRPRAAPCAGTTATLVIFSQRGVRAQKRRTVSKFGESARGGQGERGGGEEIREPRRQGFGKSILQLLNTRTSFHKQQSARGRPTWLRVVCYARVVLGERSGPRNVTLGFRSCSARPVQPAQSVRSHDDAPGLASASTNWDAFGQEACAQ